MRYWLDDSGRWSGGGTAVLNNIRSASEEYPDVFSRRESKDAIALVPRNVPTDVKRLLRPFVWMPQNALSWAPRIPDDARLQFKLRLATELVSLRTQSMVRIGGSIPPLRAGVTSPILPNVLDNNFEACLAAAEPNSAAAGAFLAVGPAHSYRNLVPVVRGFRHYRANGGVSRLLIQTSGGLPAEETKLKELAAGTDGFELRLRPADRCEVISLMKASRAILLPSSVEASPLTMLEAHAAGIPVACSDITAHRELGDGNEILFHPDSVSDVAETMHCLDDADRMATNPLQDLGNRSKQRSRWASALAAFLMGLDQ
jgi:glycosyltransferase involved in cell wall biosynthesis